MKRLWLTGLLIAALAKAQVPVATLELGKRDPLPRFFEVSQADEGLVTFGNMVRNSSRYLGLFKYDSNFRQEWSKQVLEQNGRKNVDFMTVVGDNILVFISEFNQREGVIRTGYYRYDLTGKELNQDEVISVSPNEKEHRVDLNYVVSLNKRMLLCYKNLNMQSRNDKIEFFLFDDSGEMIRKGEFTIPYDDDHFQLRKVVVSNQGNIFVLGKVFQKDRVNSPDDFEFRIFRYSSETPAQREEYSLKFGDVYITDINFRVDREENIYAAGFYSNRSTWEIAGTVYKKIGLDGTEQVSFSEKFSEAFLSKFLSGKQIERGVELKYFYLDDIVLRSDGGVLLIAEKYYTTYSSMLDIYGYWVDRTIHHYDEIIVSSVSPEGKQEWCTMVPKYQSSENNANLSYFSMVTPEGVVLAYEYSPKQMPQTIYFNAVDMEGQMSDRRNLSDKIPGNVSFFPRSCDQISNDEAVIVYFREKEKGFTIMKLNFGE